MTTQADYPPLAEPGYWCRLDQLDALLRHNDFSTSADRWQNVHDLLIKLLESGRLPADPAHLRPLLAPLFCRSAREQAQFGELFAQWLRQVKPQVAGAGSSGEERPKKQHSPRPPPSKPLLPILAGLLAAVLLTLSSGYYWMWRQDPGPEQSETSQERLPTPVPALDNGDPDPQPAVEPQPLQPVATRQPAETPKLDKDHRGYLGAGYWLLILLPGLLGLAWLACLWRGWQTVLARRRSPRQQQDPLHAITLAAPADDLFDTRPLRSALRRLHTPVAYPTRRLHIDATVQATARHAGLLQPAFAQRMAVPDCLVLVDYRQRADQMAALAELATRRLEAAGLSVHRYHYQQDPRRLYESALKGPGRWLALGELAERYPQARLLLIGEPAALIDPWRLVLRPWAGVLAWWPQRGLLATRLPPADWLRVFRAEGLMVSDLSSAGLAGMAEHLAGLPPQEIVTGPRVLLPRALQSSQAWLATLAPPENEQQALLAQLEGFLGDDGLLLLSAMAAYPELHWGLTRVLDLNLAPHATPEQRELRLLRIARLPGCREGWLPDWLRDALQERCSPAQRQTIAGLYQRLLGLADLDGQGEIALPFDLAQPEDKRGLRKWLTRLGQLAPAGSTLRDRIFANALLGNRLHRLDFLLPRDLARRLPAGVMRLLLPRLALVMLLAALAAWGLDLAWQRWLQVPAEKMALDMQQAEHGRFQVQILHTADTRELAQDLGTTLDAFGFSTIELTELRAEQLNGQDELEDMNNTVQWALDEDPVEIAEFVARRLAYLAWGLEPVVASQLSEPLPVDGALQTPTEKGQLRVWLFANGRTGSAFSDRLTQPLSQVQLQRWKDLPVAPQLEAPSEPTRREAESVPAAEQSPQPTEPSFQQEPVAALEIVPDTRISEGKYWEGKEISPQVVLKVQKQLDHLGYAPGPLDGILGSETFSAIRRFQQDRGLAVVDQPDRISWDALQEELFRELGKQAVKGSQLVQPEVPDLQPVTTTESQSLHTQQDKSIDDRLGPEMLVLPADSPEKEPLQLSNPDKSSLSYRSATTRITSFDNLYSSLGEKNLYESFGNPVGRGVENAYEKQTTNGDAVVRDYSTGLMWQQSGSSNPMSFSEALDYIGRLNRQRFAGYEDWRLPTIEEFLTLIDPPDTDNQEAYIDSIFEQRQNRFWTTDKYSSDGKRVWIVVTKGWANVEWIDAKYYVRAVRSL